MSESEETTIGMNLDESRSNLNIDRKCCLMVFDGETKGTMYKLLKGDTLIGRDNECDIVVSFPNVSRRHLKIVVDEKLNVSAEDLSSLNGTEVNGVKLKGDIPLENGDIVKVGSVTLKYLLEGEPEYHFYEMHKELNYKDDLTGFFNRRYFNLMINSELGKSKISSTEFSLVLFDVDNFKGVNDTCGHIAGDYVLKEMAGIITKNCIRNNDSFFRFGGDEFAVILPKANTENAYKIAEAYRFIVETHPFTFNTYRIPVTISLGVAVYEKGMDSATDLVRRADEALYNSKKEGRNCTSVYSPEYSKNFQPKAKSGAVDTVMMRKVKPF
ncbi:MAG: GGDEF domain-containing protein [Lentisphaerae bacterium]|nr:GGDEF domain-containing protein [Lentisphaerota bacterium]